MTKIVKHISVDVASKNVAYAIVAKQYDKDSRFLTVQLTNEGEPLMVSRTSSVIINALRGDKEAKAFAGEVNEDGTVTVPLTHWMLELGELVVCDISIIDNDDHKLTTRSFTISVEPAAYDGEDISEDDDYDILVSLIGECKEATDAAREAAADIDEKIASLELVKIVTELPDEGEENKTYFVTKTDGEGNDIYDEYMWVNDAWEYIGTKTIEVDLTDYVKNTDYAGNGKYGVVTTHGNYGVNANHNGLLCIAPADEGLIANKIDNFRPITPKRLDYAVKKGLCDSKLAETDYAWTEEEKAAARELLGAVGATDYASDTTAGVVKVNSGYGLSINKTTGKLDVLYATESDIDSKHNYRAINAAKVDYALKKGITTNTETLTDEEKAAACEWLGALPRYEHAPLQKEINVNYIYAVDAYTGEQKMLKNTNYNLAERSTIPTRGYKGAIYIPDVACEENPDFPAGEIAVNKNYVDGLAVERKQGVVTFENDGTQNNIQWHYNAMGGTIARRMGNGTLWVATPDHDSAAANKAYVDAMGGVFYAEYGVTKYAEIQAAIEAKKAVFVTYFDMGNTNYFTQCRHTVNTNPMGYSFSCVYPLGDMGSMMLGYANVNEADEWSQAWKTIALE